MNGFSADPEGLIAKGENIYKQFEDYNNLRKEINTIVDGIADGWNDQTCKILVATIHSYDGEFTKLGSIIQQISEIMVRHGSRLADSRDSLSGMAGRL